MKVSCFERCQLFQKQRTELDVGVCKLVSIHEEHRSSVPSIPTAAVFRYQWWNNTLAQCANAGVRMNHPPPGTHLQNCNFLKLVLLKYKNFPLRANIYLWQLALGFLDLFIPSKYLQNMLTAFINWFLFQASLFLVMQNYFKVKNTAILCYPSLLATVLCLHSCHSIIIFSETYFVYLHLPLHLKRIFVAFNHFLLRKLFL